MALYAPVYGLALIPLIDSFTATDCFNSKEIDQLFTGNLQWIFVKNNKVSLLTDLQTSFSCLFKILMSWPNCHGSKCRVGVDTLIFAENLL